MDEIEHYQSRIFAALDKISYLSAEAQQTPVSVEDDGLKATVTQLEARLEKTRGHYSDEQDKNARLNEKIQLLMAREQELETGDEDSSGKLQARLDGFELQLQRLRDANAHLRASNAKLREKNLKNLGDSSEINHSLQAELESLRAVRAAEVEEMDSILAELKPMMEAQNNA